MKNAARALEEIAKRRACSARPAILLDFDGTLAPIVERPSAAMLSRRTRRLLRDLSHRFPVAVISGRDLDDVEARVGGDDVACAGCHGLEWRIGGKRHEKRASASVQRTFERARKVLLELAPEFPGVIVEDKRCSFALNYRALSSAQTAKFLQAARSTISPLRKELRTLDELRTFEVLPALKWNKGECARAILREFERSRHTRYFAVYLGDSETDEDAFRALHSGVSVHIGTAERSAAHYSMPQSAVDEFMERLLRLEA